jgi:hypothetical protein
MLNMNITCCVEGQTICPLETTMFEDNVVQNCQWKYECSVFLSKNTHQSVSHFALEENVEMMQRVQPEKKRKEKKIK